MISFFILFFLFIPFLCHYLLFSFFVPFYFAIFIIIKLNKQKLLFWVYMRSILFFILEFDRFIISVFVHCLCNLSCVSEINNFSLIHTVKYYLLQCFEVLCSVAWFFKKSSVCHFVFVFVIPSI